MANITILLLSYCCWLSFQQEQQQQQEQEQEQQQEQQQEQKQQHEQEQQQEQQQEQEQQEQEEQQEQQQEQPISDVSPLDENEIPRLDEQTKVRHLPVIVEMIHLVCSPDHRCL